MVVSSVEKAVVVMNLTDEEDDVMHVQVIKETVTLPSCNLILSAVSNKSHQTGYHMDGRRSRTQP